MCLRSDIISMKYSQISFLPHVLVCIAYADICITEDESINPLMTGGRNLSSARIKL